MKKSKIPSALNYWNGWAVCSSSDGKCLLIIGNADEEGVKEKDFTKHHLRITSGDIDYIVSLIEESSFNLDDQTLKNWLSIWEKRWSSLARASNDNEDARQKLDKLHDVLRGSHQGKTPTEDLKEMIIRDIEVFRYILEQRENSKKSIEKIIREVAGLKRYDRVQQIYKGYKNLLDKCLPILGVLENFFILLEECQKNVDTPSCIVLREDIGFIFVKGEVQNGRLISSY
jgi:hypothetical protein